MIRFLYTKNISHEWINEKINGGYFIMKMKNVNANKEEKLIGDFYTSKKELTGYPSVDKPHTRFYRKDPIRDININQTIYELVFNTNKDNMNASALEYMGSIWSFDQLKEETDKAANAFHAYGLKMGDCVLCGLSNCPEAVIVLLALNKLGIISKWFDIRAGEKDIEDYANDSDCRCLIAFDLLLPRIQLMLDNTLLEKVLVIKPTDSLSKTMQLGYFLKSKFTMPKDSRYIRFKNFIKTSEKNDDLSCVSFDKNRPSVMIQSSGTTGKPKTIVHSDFSATSCTYKIAYADMPLGIGKELLVLLPPWIAYALGDAIIMPMALGTKIILSPKFEPNTIMNYLGKFTIAFAAPFNYRYLRDHYDELTEKQREGIAKIECLVSGGDKISAEENKVFEEVFGTTLVNGYGNNEGWGALTVNPTLCNKYGTVGIPKFEETIIAYDNVANKELSYGQVGEICALTDTMFLYYEGNEAETELIKKLHPDGKVWLHTGDLGYVDECGFITLSGRARRVIVRRAFKISAYTIEDKICEHPLVKECVAVEVYDEIDEHVPMAYIVLKDGCSDEENIRQSIYDKCRSELKEYEIPKYFRIVESLPYTQNGKYDFRSLELQGNEYVKVQEIK